MRWVVLLAACHAAEPAPPIDAHARGWQLWREMPWQTYERSDQVLGRPDRLLRALTPPMPDTAFTVAFDPTAAAHIRANHLGARAAQDRLATFPAFPTSAIAVKLVWHRVVNTVPVWDHGWRDAPLDDRIVHHAITTDAELASARVAMNDPAIAMGDELALVAMHISTKDLPDWLWITFWWSEQGYRMDATTAAGAPSFNPWLEARFANGEKSNCVTCHQRAVRGATEYLPVPLAPDPHPGFQTDFVWTLALEAR